MTRLDLTILFLLLGLTAHAQTMPSLDSRHILLDGSLTDSEAAARPYVFNSLQKAVTAIGDTATIYVRPWVYWADDPDVPEVAVGKNGREPFGMVITAKKLDFIGLCEDARDVVFASQRGQTQGAIGNFTMFDFHVDELHVENLTMGNYCNVDLDYPLRPELSVRRRSNAITQAHVGYVHGRRLTARNVRFVSRLNLNPLNGAIESLYERCHFECTDDALNGGNAVYRHCDFDLYGAKPLWSTFGSGPRFEDCDFYVRSANRETFFCKQGGPVTVVNCRYHAPQDSYVGWTPYPQRWLRCYQSGFTLNGKPYVIGNRQPENTILLDSIGNRTPYLGLSKHEVEVTSPSVFTLTSSEPAEWFVEKGYEDCALLSPQADGEADVWLNNDTDETADFCVLAKAKDGREAACHVRLHPTPLPPPRFLRQPSIIVEGDTARLDYELSLREGLRDVSVVSWLRDGIVVSTSHDAPQLTYRLSEADQGCRLSATIMPKTQRSSIGADTAPMESSISVERSKLLVNYLTDFHDFPCQWQPLVKEGYWTVDGYKPKDTEAFGWTFDPQRDMWAYAEGFNGAVGKGLVQAQRGARLMYTPVRRSYGDMTLQLDVDPTKTAGQGFGSATGQYMDVCLKFDTRSLSGYGLRIIRTTKHAKAVDFLLVEYNNGEVRPLTEPVSATCYRTGCTILLNYSKGRLTADVTTATPRPAGSPLPHEVHLSAKVRKNRFGGIHIQHTGSCGESTTMLHRLKAEW